MEMQPIVLDVTSMSRGSRNADLNASARTAPRSVHSPLQLLMQDLQQQFPEFTAEEIRNFKSQFDTFDTDGSGDISPEELGEALKGAGMPVPSKAKLHQMIAEHDKSGSGSIAFPDFVAMIAKMKKEGGGGGAFGQLYGQVFEVGSLLTAAAKGDSFSLSRILAGGVVDANSSDYDKRTAMHLAASEGHLDIVKTLVSNSADPNVKDRFGNTPLDDAVRHNRDDVANYLRSEHGVFGNEENFQQEMLGACFKGDGETIRRLLKMGISPNFGDYDGRTPLHLAASEGHLELVQILLEAGADLHATDRFGGTPLSDAVRSGVRTGTDVVREYLERHGGVMPEGYEKKKNPYFGRVMAVCEIVIVVLFWIFVEYAPNGSGQADGIGLGPSDVTQLYPFYQDVHVMIFIGFGYLMTFLRKYGYSSLGFNFFVAAISIQWYILCSGFFARAINTGQWRTKIIVDVDELIVADFCAAAVLITFGALLGKTSPTQLLVVAMCEVVFYAINEQISILFGVADIGGSMVIHTFGAYFGLTCSLVMTPSTAKGRSDNAATYRSDLFAMIGTIFLWLFWPSFNGAFGLGNGRERAIVNTLFSLAASCVSAFLASHYLRRGGEISMVDVQNATLAGGVAMGASANMFVQPGGALTIGTVAGVLSVVGYTKIQPWLESKIGLHDTCGVNNLHGMPGILGGISSIILASMVTPAQYGNDLQYVFPNMTETNPRNAQQQAAMQLAFLGVAIGIGGGGGVIAGKIAQLIDKSESFFLDDASWEVPNLETPYYFDVRGEINRGEIKEVMGALRTKSNAGKTAAANGKKVTTKH